MDRCTAITPVESKQLLGQYLLLDTTRSCDQREWDLQKKRKRAIVERLLTSGDEGLLKIALKLQINGYASNARHLIQQWLDRSPPVQTG